MLWVQESSNILNLNQDSNDGQRIRLIGCDCRVNAGVAGLVVNEVKLCVEAENHN